MERRHDANALTCWNSQPGGWGHVRKHRAEAPVGSAKLRVPRREPEGPFRLGPGLDRGFASTRSVALDVGFQELPCCGGVADRGFLVETEHDGQVQRVRSVSEGFLELAVDAEAFEGGCLSADGLGDPVPSDGTGLQRGLLSDQ
jgi:hypothetical protein